MIILNKKRLLTIASMILIAVFAFTFQKAQVGNTVQTMTLPVSGKIIVIDARTSENQMRELNLAVARQKRKLT